MISSSGTTTEWLSLFVSGSFRPRYHPLRASGEAAVSDATTRDATLHVIHLNRGLGSRIRNSVESLQSSRRHRVPSSPRGSAPSHTGLSFALSRRTGACRAEPLIRPMCLGSLSKAVRLRIRNDCQVLTDVPAKRITCGTPGAECLLSHGQCYDCYDRHC